MMVNVANQRSGDEWIVGSERVEVLGLPEREDDGFAIPCRIVGTNTAVRLVVYVELAS